MSEGPDRTIEGGLREEPRRNDGGGRGGEGRYPCSHADRAIDM